MSKKYDFSEMKSYKVLTQNITMGDCDCDMSDCCDGCDGCDSCDLCDGCDCDGAGVDCD